MKKINLFFLFSFLFALILINTISAKSLIQEGKTTKIQVASFAGGCFWCIEANMEKLPGVIEAISGYSDGNIDNPSYKMVSSGRTKYIETVQVRYDSSQISYDDLLAEFWRIIDPTDAKGSFVDRGYQYHSVIFYHNTRQQKSALKTKQLLDDSGLYTKKIVTEIKPLKNFFIAEDYHQNYYKKSPLRYKYYRYRSGRDQFIEKVWGNKKIDWQKFKTGSTKKEFIKPSKQLLKQQLSPLQYSVTQEEDTERPFKNTYWDNKQAGIYIDIVSGEALFSSTDKYESKTGWPSFTRPIKKDILTEKSDFLSFYRRTEIRSKIADSHLGHVFNDGPKPTGLRYCINSAALKFIPKEQLQDKGYGEFLGLFK